MLTSFFGKSNPINYLIVGILICIGYIYGGIAQSGEGLNLADFFEHLALMSLFVFSMLLFDFIIRKNQLTKSNTFAILLFSCFLLMLPVIFSVNEIIIANVFLLLAIRRIVTLYSEKNNEKKILDASIYITLASFFYFWSLLFFLALLIAILRKPETTFKQLLIPVVGFFGVFILATAYHYIIEDSFEWFFHWKTAISLNFSAYNSVKIVFPLAVIATLIIWTSLFRIRSLGSAASKEKPNQILILVILLTCIIISLASPEKTGAELFFILAPTSIIATNYLEKLGTNTRLKVEEEIWFKEILLWLVVLLPIVILIL